MDHAKEKIILTEEILEKLLKDLVNDKRFKSVKDLNLWNGGEVFLNKDIVNLLKVIKKYKEIGTKRNGHFPKINLLLLFMKSKTILKFPINPFNISIMYICLV